MKIMKKILRHIHAELDAIYGRGETDAMIRIIFEYLKGWSPVDIVIHSDSELTDLSREEIETILRRLKRREPIQYIVGDAYFCGHHFHVEPGVLIPRPETQQLVDTIADQNKAEDLRVLDIGTGSGCIAISLARALKFAQIEAIDISAKAVEIARENARRLKTKVKVVQADIFSYEPAEDSFDIIVSNPPYIDESERAGMDANVKDYEPEEALFVPDSDPIRFYVRIAEVARRALKPGGRLYFEINPRHAAAISEMLGQKGFADVEEWRDSYGKMRFAKALKPKEDEK